jgi:hypothetical protein
VPALVGPMGGSRLLVGAISVRRPDTQIALSVRSGAAEAVAECFSFLAGLELGEDLPCLTADDDEWPQAPHIMATDPIASSAPARSQLLIGDDRAEVPLHRQNERGLILPAHEEIRPGFALP